MKQVTVKKIEKSIQASIYLPGSKSITLRDFILASLANGESKVFMPAVCDDTKVMKEAMETVGIKFEEIENGYLIHGLGGEFEKGDKNIWLGGSGTSSRLLLAMALIRKDKTIFDGNESLRSRPQKYLLDAFIEMGAKVKSRSDGYLPIEIIGGEIKKNEVSINGNKTSQYFTALLNVAPLLKNGLTVKVEGDLISKPYLDITINEMKKFGVQVVNNNYQEFKVQPQIYKPAEMVVEGDASAASYFMAMATLHGITVVFKNLGQESKQGDLNFYKICEKLGAKVELGDQEVTITGPKNGELNELKEEIDMVNIPDTALTLMAMAPFIPGKTHITGLQAIPFHECNRIEDPATELRKFGVEVETGSDYTIISEKKNLDYDIIKNISIDTYDDHRMAMSFAVLGTMIGDLKINDPDCVNKTFPKFWEELDSLY